MTAVRFALVALLLLGAAATEPGERRVSIRPAKPSADVQPTYVHTWALLLEASPATPGSYTDRVIQTSEGPFEPAAAAARLREIGTQGLQIGTHYFPVHRVLLVEARQGR